MLLSLHALASPLNACAGRVAQLVRALVSHTRGPGFESLRDHSTQTTRLMQYVQKRTLIAAALCCAAWKGAAAQQPPGRPTPEQVRAAAQAKPELILQLRQKLVSSGLTREQIRARL